MRWSHMISRRRMLQILGWSGMSAALGRTKTVAAAAIAKDSVAAFEEVPPSTSGISWVHVSGQSPEMYLPETVGAGCAFQSPEMYLPETVGAGCAFLDYDNDGWMDIYLVNSGPWDFYKR